MNYAFVPGIGNKGLEDMASFLADWSGVTHLGPETSTLSKFLSFVAHDATEPVANLIIGAEANLGGNLDLALDEHTTVPATYEQISASTSIQIPPSVKGPDTSVLLKYCGLGDPRYGAVLTALKKALGNPSRVTAPRYPHVVEKTPEGYWEYMMYSFLISGNEGGQPITTRDNLIEKAVGGHFQFVNHTDIPEEVWKKWIPEELKLTDYFANNYLVYFMVSLPAAAAHLLSRSITGGRSSQPMPLLESNDLPPSTDDIVATRNFLEALLNGRQDCQGSHPYPLFGRYGYKDLDELVKAFSWTVSTSTGHTLKHALQYVGTRYLYLMRVPITDPVTTQLIFNYYPTSGTGILNFTETSDPYDMFAKI